MSQIVIRPGETDFDVQHRIQGALNLPLNERGRDQINEIVGLLRGHELDVIYTSPSEPALSTALAVGEILDTPVQTLDGLCNVHLGLWQGMLIDEFKRKYPRIFKQWEDQPEAVCAPEGESCEDVFSRVSRVLRKPMKRDQSFAIVASEPVATMIAAVLRGGEAKLCGPECTERARPLVEFVDADEDAADDLVAAPALSSWWRSFAQE
jgi:broad specificity phosphatase PhoE